MSYTPGPWRVSEEEDGIYVRSSEPFPDDWYVARATLNNGATNANARLMAAAPDLLAIALLHENAVKKGEPCLACSQAPHRSDCWIPVSVRKASK